MSENYVKLKFKVKNYVIKLSIECNDDDKSLFSFYRYIFSSECYIFKCDFSSDLDDFLIPLFENSCSVSLEIYQDDKLYLNKLLISKDSFSCLSNGWSFYNSEYRYVPIYNHPCFCEIRNILKLKNFIFLNMSLPEYIQKEFNEIEKIAYDMSLVDSGPLKKIFLKTAKLLKLNRIYDEYYRKSAYDQYYE